MLKVMGNNYTSPSPKKCLMDVLVPLSCNLAIRGYSKMNELHVYVYMYV